jgi:hypothetical protein
MINNTTDNNYRWLCDNHDDYVYSANSFNNPNIAICVKTYSKIQQFRQCIDNDAHFIQFKSLQAEVPVLPFITNKRETAVRANVPITSDIQDIILGYVIDPICTISIRGSGMILFEDIVYELPYTGFPRDLLPSRIAMYTQITLHITHIAPFNCEYSQTVKKIDVNSSMYMQLIKNEFALPAYNNSLFSGGCIVHQF